MRCFITLPKQFARSSEFDGTKFYIFFFLCNQTNLITKCRLMRKSLWKSWTWNRMLYAPSNCFFMFILICSPIKLWNTNCYKPYVLLYLAFHNWKSYLVKLWRWVISFQRKRWHSKVLFPLLLLNIWCWCKCMQVFLFFLGEKSIFALSPLTFSIVKWRNSAGQP